MYDLTQDQRELLATLLSEEVCAQATQGNLSAADLALRTLQWVRMSQPRITEIEAILYAKGAA